MAEQKRGLGRGFDSLIPTKLVEAEFDVTSETTNTGDGLRELPVDLIDPNPHQPRLDFDPIELESLAASIQVHGILQPLVVTRTGERYELVAGERRLRASKLNGMKTVPAVVRTLDEQSKLELALIENLQREDLNPMEMATAYQKLADQFSLSFEEIGARVGRDRSTVQNVTRLLMLPLEAKREVAAGNLTETMGRTLLMMPDEQRQLEFMNLIFKHKWSVRQAENYARGYMEKGSHTHAKKMVRKSTPITRSLTEYLGTKVLQQNTAKGGKLIIEYYSEEELERIYKAIQPGGDGA
ncbi:ParB/RepB/Spo0J family partition protein [Candidatus Saccharibacteria bacterium]|nr:ParB/RepB/Spo0J family partition protein [Candidatus Saccharibacteria bacterium]